MNRDVRMSLAWIGAIVLNTAFLRELKQSWIRSLIGGNCLATSSALSKA